MLPVSENRMENIVVIAVFLSYFLCEALGGEQCEITSQSLTVTQYCEVGGCCIPGNLQRLTKESELCCMSSLFLVLIGVFVGIPIFLLIVIFLVIVVKRCVKNRKPTTLTSLNVTETGMPQYQPKPPDYTHAHVAARCPAYSPSRTWQQRPSLVLPGAISQSTASQHVQPVPSSSRDNTDQSNLPTSPPPPYFSRASGCVSPVETAGSSLLTSSVSALELHGRSSSPIVMEDLTDTGNEEQQSNNLAFI
ncbi:uncharacterized protein LOC110443243 [Mizuhopecten yessoensis]|uniref:Uncharacterized protein n=1 Tax=Mizuhopecten yessoensis TaxID=6573 RepID=A0A210PFD7_MIZYE|nr:uncharacterized protein LOC110443243 [Mizuhopecten yessoensis]OWF35205.1 hypothetical protein KP79_PYT14221 [Mizuhopecten yessoensis]